MLFEWKMISLGQTMVSRLNPGLAIAESEQVNPGFLSDLEH